MDSLAEIKLTAEEIGHWDWAQDAAQEYWDDDYARDDGLHFDTCPVLPVQGRTGRILRNHDVIEDMIYRLGTQLVEMASEQGGVDRYGRADRERMSALRTVARANTLVRKLEALLL